MRRVAARLVPKELNFLQKEHRKAVAEDMISRASSDFTFMKRIITGDETWVYEYDMQTSQQSSEYRLENEPNPKKPRQSRSKIKVMLTVFFDYHGVVHSEFLPDGQAVNKEYYLSVMRRLRENIRRKRPDLWKNNSWFLHHDNAPSHTSTLVREFLAKNSTNVIEQAPYSPDMAPCDFFLFPKLKLPLRGRRFESIEAIKENSQKELKALPSSAFKKCFEEWEKRWRMYIVSDGAYFEGDKINLHD
ncbi:Mariner Mos1 transposase [Anthophora quadrimaculata]